jgi:hypothetical protein
MAFRFDIFLHWFFDYRIYISMLNDGYAVANANLPGEPKSWFMVEKRRSREPLPLKAARRKAPGRLHHEC